MRSIAGVVALLLAGCADEGGEALEGSWSNEFGIVEDGCIEGRGALDSRYYNNNVRFNAQLDCAPDGESTLVVRWRKDGMLHEFELGGLGYHDCTFRPGYEPGDGAILNEMYGSGWGTLDGAEATVEFVFRDAGEPGTEYDHGAIKIWDAEGNLVQLAAGLPVWGNIDAGECEVDEEPPPEEPGCTYTQGYWKNHNMYATNNNQNVPWPAVPNWSEPTEDADLCGMSWLEILETPPAGGDAWTILAHQWIAAKLNVANGASRDGIGAYLRDGRDLLLACEIAEEDRQMAIDVADMLDDYNNGLVGPGHCDDEVIEPE